MNDVMTFGGLLPVTGLAHSLLLSAVLCKRKTDGHICVIKQIQVSHCDASLLDVCFLL